MSYLFSRLFTILLVYVVFCLLAALSEQFKSAQAADDVWSARMKDHTSVHTLQRIYTLSEEQDLKLPIQVSMTMVPLTQMIIIFLSFNWCSFQVFCDNWPLSDGQIMMICWVFFHLLSSKGWHSPTISVSVDLYSSQSHGRHWVWDLLWSVMRLFKGSVSPSGAVPSWCSHIPGW